MTAVAALVHTPCQACGAVVPLQAYVQQCTCVKCGQLSENLDWSWVANASWSEPTIGRQSKSEASRNVLGQVSPAPVVCVSCKGELPQPLLESVFSTMSGNEAQIPCPACQAATLMRRVPLEEVDSYGIKFRDFTKHWCAMIGEQLPAANQAPPEHGKEPTTVAYPCTSCGAPLTIDGSTRTPLCQFCNARIFLPDSLWEALHPPPSVRPFFLWLNENGLAQRKYMDATAAVQKRWYIFIGIWAFLGGPVGGTVCGFIDAMHDFMGIYAVVLGAGIVVPLIVALIYGAWRNRRLRPLSVGHSKWPQKSNDMS